MHNVFDIMDYGAQADGITDCTAAIQRAIDEAAKVRGGVLVPPGEYLTGRLYGRPGVSIQGARGWGYKDIGGSVLRLLDPGAPCMLDMTDGFSATIRGLQLIGAAQGRSHGIAVNNPLYNGNGESVSQSGENNFHEGSLVVEDCQVRGFGGNGLHFDHAFVFTVRHSSVHGNRGHGIYIDGWDGWITDNLLSFNGGCGVYGGRSEGHPADVEWSRNGICASVSILQNRIEWNQAGGVSLSVGGQMIINANSFDRSYGPALRLRRDNAYVPTTLTVTGNLFNRSGKPWEGGFTDPYESSHIYLESGENLTLTGNVFAVGRDDGEVGVMSPAYGVVYKGLKGAVMTGNALYHGCLSEGFVDLGGNEAVTVQANAL